MAFQRPSAPEVVAFLHKRRDRMTKKAIVFLGPSMPLEEARQHLNADYRPPLARGDLTQAVLEAPPLIGIIDGQFYQALSVSPGEVVVAVQSGMRLMGSSSMGALRAAE